MLIKNKATAILFNKISINICKIKQAINQSIRSNKPTTLSMNNCPL